MARLLLLLITGLFLNSPRVAYALQVPTVFDSITAEVVSEEIDTYEDLNTLLRPYRKDSSLMLYFLDRSQESNYPTGMSYAYNQLGIAARNRSEFSKAARYHQQGLEAAIQAGNREMRIFSLNMLGVVYRRNDAIRTALDYNQEALALAESVKNPSKSIKLSINVALNSIGNIYQTLEQYELAKQYFERSLALERDLQNDRGIAVNLQNIGECLEAQGDFEGALEQYRNSLAYNEKIDSPRGRAICRNSIARILVKKNAPMDALSLLGEAWLEAVILEDRHISTNILLNQGWAYYKMGQYSEAERVLNQALQESRSYNLPMNIASAHRKLADLYEVQGEYAEALKNYQLSKKTEDEITNQQNISYVNDMIIRYDTEKKIDQIQMLAQENEIVKLKLKRNENTQLVSILLLFLFSLIFYILYRQSQLKHDKKLLTLEQSMLRSQMNPHFLFNSLNSIKLFIINNEKKNAVHYLNKFSKLVRKILEASSVREITLAEELETVALYMNIENIRFNHEIHFEITVDNDIDPEQVRIPSLILQPFLENAIWHGLSAKKGKKSINLHIYKELESYIHIAITDNGVGRAASEKTKKERVAKRKSVGIAITKERLANFSKDFENSYKIEIQDLLGKHGEASGTRVILLLPTR